MCTCFVNITGMTTFAHFSFANAGRDVQFDACPAKRLSSIYQFFEWASNKKISIIGCTEGHREQNGFEWEPVLHEIREKWGYQLVCTALKGDQTSMSFGTQLFAHTSINVSAHSIITLTPPELEGSFRANRAASLQTSDVRLVYCHLTLSRDGKDAAYNDLLYELKEVSKLVSDGCIVFGDFNLTNETRMRLFKEEEALMKNLSFQFGGRREDISFITFPHDHVPCRALEFAPDAILQKYEDGCTCVSPLDAICSLNDLQCNRYLPWTPFKEIPLDWSVSDIVSYLKSDESPYPVQPKDYASDHWILCFTV